MRNVTPLHMLVIDDHGTLCHSLSPLSVAGDRVTCAPTADQGVELARNEPFDLIVVDLDRCGNKENSFIAQRIKRAAHTPHLPVIVVSSDPDESVHHQFFDLIPRPLDLERVRTDISIIRYRKRGSFVVPPLEDDHFKEFQKFIAAATALRFEERNRYQLERALANRMQLLRIDSHADYFTYLSQHGEDRQELDRLILHLTVGETSFFRYPAQFQILRQSIIPTLAKRSSTEPIRIWSAGCSTGEEPYSLAITLMEALPDWRQRTIEILATDINHEALRRAREGFYGSRTLRRTDKTVIDRYFEPHGEDYRVRQELRDLITFRPLNLSTDPFPAAGLDLIFCRNVLIYFDTATMGRILSRFASLLPIGGHLFLGHAETLTSFSLPFRRLVQGGGFYYRHCTDNELLPPTPPPPKGIRLSASTPRANDKIIALPPRLQKQTELPTADELFAEARALFERDDFLAAAPLLDLLLQKLPRHPRALVLKGFMLANSGQNQAARDLCQQALSIDDLSAEAYFLRALLAEIDEDPAAALADYQRVLLLDSDFLMARYGLARLHQSYGSHKDSSRELNNLIRLLSRLEGAITIPFSAGLSASTLRKLIEEQLQHLAAPAGR